MRRVLGCVLLVAAITGCTSTGHTTTSTTTANILLPDDTTPAPGSCDDDATDVAVPTIVIDGTKTPATYGKGSVSCDTIAGSGYLLFDYDPILLQADGAVQVVINDGSTATIDWTGGAAFTETSAGHFTSGAPAVGCSRLTIKLTAESGAATATYGADIQVGGATVACPQRGEGPHDPSDTDTISGSAVFVS